jgi:hypothetical protein
MTTTVWITLVASYQDYDRTWEALVKLRSVYAVLLCVLCAPRLSSGEAAQQPTPAAPPSCVISADETYGYTEQNPIRVGGGATTIVAREQAYLNALRGPDRQPLQYRRDGTRRRPDGTLLDVYDVTVAGVEKHVTLFIDAYHWADLAVPRGLTCVALFSLQPPPPDPLKTQEQNRQISLDYGATRDLLPIPLDADGTRKHGIALDHSRLIARAARAAAATGRPLSLDTLGEVGRAQTLVVAFPIACEGNMVAPTDIHIVNAQQQPAPREPGTLKGEALRTLVDDLQLPEPSLGVRFMFGAFRQGEVIKISYEQGCEQREVLLPLVISPPRPLQQIQGAAMPAGLTVPDAMPTVRVQVIIGMDGVPRSPEYVNGPFALAEAAKQAASEWRWDPPRANGAPMQTTLTVAITFRK